jgi:DNA polymerase
MDNRRAELLQEMGLSPIWRVRGVRTPEPELAAQPSPQPSLEPPPRSPLPPAVHTMAGAAPAVVAAQATPIRTSATEPGPAPAIARAQAIGLLDWDPLVAHIAECTACTLCRTRRNTVPGVGSRSAGWMFVGEAPGADEDAHGEPFVGQGGKLLDNMLRAIGLDRRNGVYIANVLKCRPPNNRNPEAGEVAACSPYLERQLELIRPRLIVALGRFAAMTLLDTDASIASLRGRVHQYRGVPLIVTYHPAYLLRTLPEKAKAWEDLLFAKATFARLQNEKAAQT